MIRVVIADWEHGFAPSHACAAYIGGNYRHYRNIFIELVFAIAAAVTKMLVTQCIHYRSGKHGIHP